MSRPKRTGHRLPKNKWEQTAKGTNEHRYKKKNRSSTKGSPKRGEIAGSKKQNGVRTGKKRWEVS